MLKIKTKKFNLILYLVVCYSPKIEVFLKMFKEHDKETAHSYMMVIINNFIISQMVCVY